MKQNLTRKEAIEWINEADPHEPTDWTIKQFLIHVFDIEDKELKRIHI